MYSSGLGLAQDAPRERITFLLVPWGEGRDAMGDVRWSIEGGEAWLTVPTSSVGALAS